MNHLFSRLLWLSVLTLFLASCGSDDEVTPSTGQTSITLTEDATYTTNDFEVGENINFAISVTAPEGITVFQINKSVNGGTATQITSDFTNLPSPNATTFSENYEVPVSEMAGDEVTITVQFTQGQESTFTSATYTYDVVAQGQGGGGGVFPLLRSQITVSLGSQNPSNTTGSYLTSSTGTVNTSTEVGNLSDAAKAAVDITFGVVGTNDQAWVSGTAFDALISPDARDGAGFNNPALAQASATTFKAEASVMSIDDVTSSSVENNIDHTSGTSSIQRVTAGNVYSFVNASGAKGYVEVTGITGSTNNRTATLDVIVQIVQ